MKFQLEVQQDMLRLKQQLNVTVLTKAVHDEFNSHACCAQYD